MSIHYLDDTEAQFMFTIIMFIKVKIINSNEWYAYLQFLAIIMDNKYSKI